MILVDTSVWIDHFREPDQLLFDMLFREKILIHPYVIGELALGNLANRKAKLQDLQDLTQVTTATDFEALELIERQNLFGKGIGYVDTHLLASLHLTPRTKLWSRDKRLAAIATSMDLCFNPDKFLH